MILSLKSNIYLIISVLVVIVPIMSSNKPDFLKAPTAFTIGAKNEFSSLNNRTERLRDHNLANVLGKKQHKLRYADNELFIDQESVKDINRTLEKNDLGELTIRPTASLLKVFHGLGEDIDGLHVINPPEVQYFASDKAHQRKQFWEDPGAVIPYQPTDEYLNQEDEADLETLAEDFEGLEHLGVVEQPRADSQGDGIEFYDSFEDALEEYRKNGLPKESMISLQLPVVYDQRVIAAGYEPVTSMKRFSGEDKEVCSLSKVKGSTYKEKAINAKEQGYVEPVDIEDVDPAVENILEDHVERMKEETDEENMWIGWDFFAVDPYQMQEFPDFIKDSMLHEEYRTEEGNYLVLGEPNASPGSGIDIVNQEYEEQDSAANILRYGESVSRGQSFDRGLESIEQVSSSELYNLVKEHQV